MQNKLEKVWAKQVENYRWIMKRTPPIAKPIMWIVMTLWFIPFLFLYCFKWLIGFYTCHKCGNNYHVFAHPKGGEFGDDDVCEKCQ
jgi:hypothetical protein